MITIFTVWALLILLEILRNGLASECLLDSCSGSSAPFVYKAMNYWQWWGMIPMMLFTFWFLFDYGLNLARNKKPFYYLNPRGSLLDRLQNRYPAPYPWFWWKFMLMLTGLDLFIEGLDVIWRGY